MNEIWSWIVDWQNSILRSAMTIDKKEHLNKNEMLNEWCNILINTSGLCCDAAQIFTHANSRDKTKLKCMASKSSNYKEITRLDSFDISEEENVRELSKSQDHFKFKLYTNTESSQDNVVTRRELLPRSICNLLIVKIFYKVEVLGYIYMYNFRPASIQSREEKTRIVPKVIGEISSTLKTLGESIGESIDNLRDMKLVKSQIDELIASSGSEAKTDFYNLLTKHIVELSGCDSFAIWDYDTDFEVFILNYIYGNLKKKPNDTIIHVSNCWLGTLVSKKRIYGYIDDNTEEPTFDKYWVETIGRKSVNGFIVYSDENTVQGAITLFNSNRNIQLDNIDSLQKYFHACFHLLESRTEKDIKERRGDFHSRISDWINVKDNRVLFSQLVTIVKDVIRDCECSIFTKNDDDEDLLYLRATTSDLIKFRVGEPVYSIGCKSGKKSGITGKIVKNPAYNPIIFKAADNLDYSGGECDEITAYGNASIIFARIIIDDQCLGVIRCVIKSFLYDISDMSSIYKVLKRDDLHLLEHFSIILGMLIKQIDYSNKERENWEELEHESLTPIAVVGHELDVLRRKLRSLVGKKSEDIMYLINKNYASARNAPLWNDETLKDFRKWSNSLNIAKIEMQQIEMYIRSTSVADIAKEKYDIDSYLVNSVIVPVMHHASYLARISTKILGNFSEIIDYWRRSGATISVDRSLFNQAFLHIVKNAIKYSDHSRDGIDLWFASEQLISDGQPKFVFYVYNYGPVIEDIEHDQIFDKRKIGKTGVFTKKGGKGLGLYIARTILNNLSGDVKLLPTFVDNVTCFIIELPISTRR